MDVLDELTLRKRRDRLFNPQSMVMAQLFTYAPDPPLPPPLQPVQAPFMFSGAGPSIGEPMQTSVPPTRPHKSGDKRPHFGESASEKEIGDVRPMAAPRGNFKAKGNVSNDGAQSPVNSVFDEGDNDFVNLISVPDSAYFGIHNVTTGASQLKKMGMPKVKAPSNVPPPKVGQKRPPGTSDLREKKNKSS